MVTATRQTRSPVASASPAVVLAYTISGPLRTTKRKPQNHAGSPVRRRVSQASTTDPTTPGDADPHEYELARVVCSGTEIDRDQIRDVLKQRPVPDRTGQTPEVELAGVSTGDEVALGHAVDECVRPIPDEGRVPEDPGPRQPGDDEDNEERRSRRFGPTTGVVRETRSGCWGQAPHRAFYSGCRSARRFCAPVLGPTRARRMATPRADADSSGRPADPGATLIAAERRWNQRDGRACEPHRR